MAVDVEALERRVAALEAANNVNTQTLNWVVGTLGRVAADVSGLKQDVKEVKTDLRDLKADVERFEGDFNIFRRELPAQIADVMREVLKERR